VFKFRRDDGLTPRAERLPVTFKVEVFRDDGGSVILNTRNISDSGCFLVTDGIVQFPIGSLVRVRLHGNLGCGEEPPTLMMRVMRTETLGIGLRFEDQDSA
jgi:hypothetical protein